MPASALACLITTAVAFAAGGALQQNTGVMTAGLAAIGAVVHTKPGSGHPPATSYSCDFALL